MHSKTGDRRHGLGVRLAIMAAMAMVAVITLFGSGTMGANATDCTFSLSSTGYSGVEGSAIPITVTKSGGSCENTVRLTFGGGDAVDGTNYNNPGNIDLGFSAGATTGQYSFQTLDDAGVGNKSLMVTLSFQTVANGDTLANTPATITIVDNDGGPTFTFSQANYNVTEGDGFAQVTVNRTGMLGSAVSVNYATSNGGATAGSDYTAVANTLPFSANVTQRTSTSRSQTTR